jgi:hypothetical protein
MPLSNKNRRKKAKQMKRDEGGRHVHPLLSPCMSPLGLRLISLPLLVTIIAQNDNCSMVYERSDRIFICLKGKAKECSGLTSFYLINILLELYGIFDYAIHGSMLLPHLLYFGSCSLFDTMVELSSN